MQQSPRLTQNPANNIESATPFNWSFLSNIPASVLEAISFSRDQVAKQSEAKELSERLADEVEAMELRITELNSQLPLNSEELNTLQQELNALNAERVLADDILIKAMGEL